MIPLTVVVGVGGMGSTIAVRVQEHLSQLARERDRAQGNTFNVEQVKQNTRIFAVDTRPDAARLSTGNTWNLTPLAVDRTIARKLLPVSEGGDPTFQQWWLPERKKLGPYLLGAGAVRVKGKYAFYEEGWGIAEQIAAAINSLLIVRNQQPMHSPPVFVFIVGSLSGGTGSGMMLPLTLHLRDLVENENVQFIGAIPLGSIMEKAPPAAFRDAIWANCAAALRELEWWQVARDRRPHAISPFLQRGPSIITGDKYPFDLCYLFTESNRAIRQVGSRFQDYAELIADAIALDINSDAADNAQGSLSNFIQLLNEQRERPPYNRHDPRTRACKSVTFGSVSAASLEYPVASITRYLGLQLLDTALAAYLLPTPNPDTAARDWAATQAEPALTAAAIGAALHGIHIDETTRVQTAIAPRPVPQTAGIDRRQIPTEMQRARQNFERHWLAQLEKLIDLNTPQLTEHARAALWRQVEALLARPDGYGFIVARQFIADLRRVLADWQLELRDALNASLPENKQRDPERLPTATRDYLNGQAQAALKQLRDVCERGVVTNRAVQEAVERYTRGWWQPYTRACEQGALLKATVKQYDILLQTLNAMQGAVNAMTGALADARQRNAQAMRTTLGGGENRIMMLEERVLNDARLVKAVFGEQLAAELRSGEGSPVAAIARRMTIGATEDGGLRALLRAAAGPQPLGAAPVDLATETRAIAEHGLEEAESRFRSAVEALTIWQALRREAVERRRQNLRDEALDLVAPPGLELSERELWLRYTEQRVKHCLETAAPCWNLDNARLDQTTHPLKRDGLIWYSTSSLLGLSQDEHEMIVRMLAALAEREEVKANADVGSPYRVLAMQREVGAPLFMLDAGERQKLREGERAYERTFGTAYADRRFLDVLPPDFEMSSLHALFDHPAAPAAQTDEPAPAPVTAPPSPGPSPMTAQSASPDAVTPLRNGQPPVPETYYDFIAMVNEWVAQGKVTMKQRDEAIGVFGVMHNQLDQGTISPEIFQREMTAFVMRLAKPAPA